MEFVTNFLDQYGVEILMAILTAVGSYVALFCKGAIDKFINNKTKKDVVKTVVKAVEQVYKDIHGEDKLNQAISDVTQVLNEKNIPFTETEVRLLIESTLAEFNGVFDGVNETSEEKKSSKVK